MSSHQTRLRLESLESRQMMAGDVSAFAISRILYVNGDVLSNGVALVNDGNGNINVVGLAQGGEATTINDGASQVFTKIKDVVITMNKGDDAIVVSDLFINGNLYIQGAKDNDVVALGQFDDTDSLIDDAVDSLLGALTVKKSVIIDTSDGDDTVLARDTTVTKSIVVSTGVGNDTVRFDSQDNPGDPTYVPGLTAIKGVTISTATGNDAVLLDRVTTEKALTISTSNDNDDVTISRVSAKSLNAPLGSGDDDISVEDTTILKTATFNGDTGANTYTDLGGSTFGKLVRKNFQNLV